MRRRPVALVLVGVLAGLVLAQVYQPSQAYVAANAPRGSDALTVSVSVRPSSLLVPLGCPDQAEVWIAKNDVVTRVPHPLRIARCAGELEVPTSLFARSNGQHLVTLRSGGSVWTTLADVRKVVSYTWVRPFPQPEEAFVRIDVSLEESRAQPLTGAVITSGILELELYYERCEIDEGPPVPLPVPLPTPPECSLEHTLAYWVQLPVQRAPGAAVFVPYERLQVPGFEQAPEGWYSVTARFHNREALGNGNVPMDPTLQEHEPPLNWFLLRW